MTGRTFSPFFIDGSEPGKPEPAFPMFNIETKKGLIRRNLRDARMFYQTGHYDACVLILFNTIEMLTDSI